MTREELAIKTILLLIGTNAIGLVYSLIVLKTNWFSSFQIQKKPYEKGVFSKRMPRYLVNFSILLILSGVGAYIGYPLSTNGNGLVDDCPTSFRRLRI